MQQQTTAPLGARWVPLGGNRGAVTGWTLVDEADYEMVIQSRWSLHADGYARSSGSGYRVFLHRLLLGLEKGNPRQGDHINRDRLDNRRTNLRIVSLAENLQNQGSRGGTSRHRGVCWVKRDHLWAAQVSIGNKTQNIGRFSTEAEAAAAVAHFRAEHLPFSVELG